MHFHASTLPLVQLFLRTAWAIVDGIDPRDALEEMEHIMVDNGGHNSDAFVNVLNPCSNYLGFSSGGSKRGEQSSAQWVRIVFHDFITADVSAGTGGLDGSIAYEADRSENPGVFISDTLNFMAPTMSAYLGMADNIALGIYAAVANCGGANSGIQLRAGRIDATEAGPAGVPGPEIDLETTLARFSAAGFNQSDAIAVTACGHSLGRIHYSNFPDIVPESAVSDNNLNGGVGFDDTPADFDASVVNEYLDGTGQLGGLLVTTPNTTVQSDLRLYSSDSNATLRAMSDDDSFRTKCYSLFNRMIDTVPSNVKLSDPITPMTWKAIHLALDIDSEGNVTLAGEIRNLYTTGSPPKTVSYDVSTSDGKSTTVTSDESSGSGTSLFGKTNYYSFNTSLSSPGTTSLSFGDVTYPINDNIFILPAQSSSQGSMTIKAAALTSLDSHDGMTAVLWVTSSASTGAGTVVQKVTADMTEYGTAGPYTLYKGSFSSSRGRGTPIAQVIMGDASSATVKTDIFSSH